MSKKITLILGGARSGKSSYAQQYARSCGDRVLFIATARVLDEEMERRVAAHRSDRPSGWETLEAPEHLYTALQKLPAIYDAILFDCVTLFLSNAFCRFREDAPEDDYIGMSNEAVEDLLKAIHQRPEPWILVSNEVGLGIVPNSLMGRVFRDMQGRVNQQLAALANDVYFMTAGIPVRIK